MREHQYCKILVLLSVLTGICFVPQSSAGGQTGLFSERDSGRSSDTPVTRVCEQTAAPSPLKDSSPQPVQNSNKREQACPQNADAITDSSARKVIVIGFVGGFVSHDDAKHAEVQFAAHLRDRYASGIYAEVFENHSRQKALRQVLRLLDTNSDGILTAKEREQARIIIFGHSWGASETVMLARELERKHIPVLLTIQVDSIGKPGQGNSTIPPNVANAVNFYQSSGLLHGRSEITAEDPVRTTIIGNFQMTYKDHPINCDNYPWYARVFTKSHIEIESDPRVWDQAASLIDSELSGTRSTTQALSR